MSYGPQLFSAFQVVISLLNKVRLVKWEVNEPIGTNKVNVLIQLERQATEG